VNSAEQGAKRASAHVDSQRLNQHLMALAAIGGRSDGGVSRETLTELDLEARRYVCKLARELGCSVFQDDCGNLFFRREGSEDLPPVLTGSHIDTQPVGGKYDGAYGVIAGLEVLAALNDAGISTRAPIEVVSWTNEEGSRFAPGAMGSSAFVDPTRMPDYLESTDRDGIRLGDALQRAFAAFPYLPRRPLGQPLTACIELHIEQGPVLERAQSALGVVTSIQSVRWFSVCCSGRMAHAGTTPMDERCDAMSAALEIAAALQTLAGQWRNQGLRMTLGRWQVIPNSVNTIPGRVEFSIDARCVDEQLLEHFEAGLRQLLEDYQWDGQLEVERFFARGTTHFPPQMLELTRRACEQTCQALELKAPLALTSGAFHDAMYLAEQCPTAMIFVPSRHGISHNAKEYTEPGQLYAGARALAYAVTELALR
jgi:N-carbamoyl-L-amino-acid hydrolase